MILVYRGAGPLVPIIGILAAVLVNLLTTKLFDGYYYQEHRWPKLAVLLLAGVGCLATGLLLKKRRAKAALKAQQNLTSAQETAGAAKEPKRQQKREEPLDHFFYIPIQYWSLGYFAGAIFYLLTNK